MTPTELMQLALDQARQARAMDEVPIGCVIFHHPSNSIIGTGYNRRIVDHDPTGHAEIIAIRSAAKFLNNWRLLDCLRQGITPDSVVYDAAAWSSIIELSVRSVATGSAPVVIPDFTRGLWNTMKPVTKSIG